MAVGDFDYDAMYQSQRFLGPLLFWVFIFLVFFVLISMFIALLSEAYEKAKEETPTASASIWEAVIEDNQVSGRRRISSPLDRDSYYRTKCRPEGISAYQKP